MTRYLACYDCEVLIVVYVPADIDLEVCPDCKSTDITEVDEDTYEAAARFHRDDQ